MPQRISQTGNGHINRSTFNLTTVLNELNNNDNYFLKVALLWPLKTIKSK